MSLRLSRRRETSAYQCAFPNKLTFTDKLHALIKLLNTHIVEKYIPIALNLISTPFTSIFSSYHLPPVPRATGFKWSQLHMVQNRWFLLGAQRHKVVLRVWNELQNANSGPGVMSHIHNRAGCSRILSMNAFMLRTRWKKSRVSTAEERFGQIQQGAHRLCTIHL